MDKKGQALVEFVIIMPIIMMIIFIIIDFSNVFYQKNNLENTTNDIVRLRENGKSNEYIQKSMPKDIKISYIPENNNIKLEVTKNIKLITPFSSMFFKSPYQIKTERVLLYE